MSSWVIIRKSTGAPVLETWSRKVVDRINTKAYEAVPILKYLYALNARAALAGDGRSSRRQNPEGEREYGPNVELIRKHATRVIKGKIPLGVRKELMTAVKLGQLGRLKKDGLKPEIFFHPDHRNGAKERQVREAEYALGLIVKVVSSDEYYVRALPRANPSRRRRTK